MQGAGPSRRPRQRHARDNTDIGSGNLLPTAPGRQRRRNDPFSFCGVRSSRGAAVVETNVVSAFVLLELGHRALRKYL